LNFYNAAGHLKGIYELDKEAQSAVRPKTSIKAAVDHL